VDTQPWKRREHEHISRRVRLRIYIYMHTCVCVYMHIYMYISMYTYSRPGRGVYASECGVGLRRGVVCMFACTYIRIYTQNRCIYINVYLSIDVHDLYMIYIYICSITISDL